MKMKRKAQINHVFMFLIAIMIIGAIALIGMRSINGIMKDKCTADIIIFKNEITEKIASNNDYGSVNYEKISAPCKYYTLCLVDAQTIKNPLLLTGMGYPGEQIIRDSVKDGVEKNIFLIGKDEVRSIGYVKQLKLSDPSNVTCIRKKAGVFNLLLKGQGRLTEVSEKT